MFKSVDNKKITEKIDEHTDKRNVISRRDFIKGIAVSAIIAASPFGIVNNAFAGEIPDYDKAPQYIKTSYLIDKNTFWAWRHTKILKDPLMGGRILDLMDNNQLGVDETIRFDTPTIDPGYHIIACETWTSLIKHNNTGIRGIGGNMERLHYRKFIEKNSNPQMKNFADSLFEYYRKWELGKSTDIKQIERGFLSAIFGSLNLPLKNVEWYMADETEQKEREQYISKILPKIEEMKKGINIKNPSKNDLNKDNFYKLILIREASRMILHHYSKNILNTNDNNKIDLIDLKQKPLFPLIKFFK